MQRLKESSPSLIIPTLSQLKETYDKISSLVARTPSVTTTPLLREASVLLKLEVFQRSGTFKVRGVMANLTVESNRQRAVERGVVAVSAGNHAIAVAYAAKMLNLRAKVVMPKNASPHRVQKCRSYGAVVELVESAQAGFARVAQLEAEDGLLTIPPFNGESVTRGAAGGGA
jgi:threonine dehydratase